ncbi:hypothetical protein HMPREF1981_02540 [Bacteroides pyogenes F0041]|uniref:Uncharacterized protein n=1 Tax=Bacteroides pyogenes F0041 TaxID=1321819 RepID=U2DQQ0_9BACE|nr:hypothetical protein HMPREF1981_02540 [Bacteroides pyogenes F0041]
MGLTHLFYLVSRCHIRDRKSRQTYSHERYYNNNPPYLFFFRRKELNKRDFFQRGFGF